eukprot:TRINITY_DN51293_c0_g1_i1.p1 TRINITY_DN51293_c0_g1~~TRINITY_DN51293_c0_g1_i1.p1  ORF type:complete len:415 (-),score=33.93 TRINITY_DN51293_c0_g1_i1:83-1327(-)
MDSAARTRLRRSAYVPPTLSTPLLREQELLERARREMRPNSGISPAACCAIVIVCFPFALQHFAPPRDNGSSYDFRVVDQRTRNLTYEKFWETYLRPKRPVIIQDLASRVLPRTWNWNYVKDVCADMIVDIRRYSSEPQDGETWYMGDMEPRGVMKLADYMGAIEQGLESQTYRDRLLVFDARLAKGCSAALKDFTFPKYVTNDVLKRIPLERHEDDPFWSQPGLFIGLNHTLAGPLGAGLHRDAFSSHFWQLIVEGKKEWITFCGLSTRQLENDLYPRRIGANLNPQNYRFDAFNPDYARFPRAQVVMRESAAHFVSRPGDFVFIPAGCPHQARTLTPTSLALSGNFVDSTNFREFADTVRRHGDPAVMKVVEAALGVNGRIPDSLREPPDLRFDQHIGHLPRPWEIGARIIR